MFRALGLGSLGVYSLGFRVHPADVAEAKFEKAAGKKKGKAI